MAEKRKSLFTVRLTEADRKRLNEATQSAGYSTVADYVRESLMRDTAQTQLGDELRKMEQRVASTLATYSAELHRIRREQYVVFAMLENLAKALFTYMPAPGRDEMPAAVAAATAKYDRYLKSVGIGLQNGSKASAQKLAETLQRS